MCHSRTPRIIQVQAPLRVIALHPVYSLLWSKLVTDDVLANPSSRPLFSLGLSFLDPFTSLVLLPLYIRGREDLHVSQDIDPGLARASHLGPSLLRADVSHLLYGATEPVPSLHRLRHPGRSDCPVSSPCVACAPAKDLLLRLSGCLVVFNATGRDTAALRRPRHGRPERGPGEVKYSSEKVFIVIRLFRHIPAPRPEETGRGVCSCDLVTGRGAWSESLVAWSLAGRAG
jgi:hypothetical protein